MSRNRRFPREFRYRIKGLFCVYCGELADTEDHFPPLSAGLAGFLLPACRECNSLAGTDYPHDFSARASLVHIKLEARYRKLVDTPEWSVSELKSLGFTLRTTVKSWSERRKQLMARLNWNALSYLAMLPQARDFIAVTDGVEGEPEKQQKAFKKRFEAFSETTAA